MHVVCLSTSESMFGQMAPEFCEMPHVVVRRLRLYNFAPTSDMCDVTFTLSRNYASHCLNDHIPDG